jgi:hypothetical protein
MGLVNGIAIDDRILNELDWLSAVHRARDLAAYEDAAPIREADHARTLLFLALGDCGLDSDDAWAWGEACGREMLGVDVDAAYAAHRVKWGLINYGVIPMVPAGPMPEVHCHGDTVPCFCGNAPRYGPIMACEHPCQHGVHTFVAPVYVGDRCNCGSHAWTPESQAFLGSLHGGA